MIPKSKELQKKLFGILLELDETRGDYESLMTLIPQNGFKLG